MIHIRSGLRVDLQLGSLDRGGAEVRDHARLELSRRIKLRRSYPTALDIGLRLRARELHAVRIDDAALDT